MKVTHLSFAPGFCNNYVLTTEVCSAAFCDFADCDRIAFCVTSV